MQTSSRPQAAGTAGLTVQPRPTPPRTRARRWFILLLAAAMPATLSAQGAPSSAAERDAVLAAVQAFFDTMASKDVDAARRVLIPEGRFFSMRQQDGKTVLRTFTNAEYLRDLPARTEAVRERMWQPDVRIRGSIATVWTPYDFWRDGVRSHCGIDAFDLVRTDAGWQIAGGTYTVETTCEPSPLGPLKPSPPAGR